MTNERDAFDGMGGSYTVDEKTGKRVLLHRTAEKPVEAEKQKPYADAQENDDQPSEDE